MTINNPFEHSRLAPLCFDAIAAAGHDLDAFLRRLGMNADSIQLVGTTHTVREIDDFWRSLEAFTKDADIGLSIGQHLHVCKGEVFDYLYLSAESFGQALERSLMFMRLLSDDLHWSIERVPSGVWVQASAQDEALNDVRHFFECLFLGIARFWRGVSDEQVGPALLEFTAESPLNIQQREAMFGCPAQYGCAANRLFIPADLLSCPGLYQNPALFSVHEQYARQLMQRLDEHAFLCGARTVITELLQFGEVNLEVASRRLGLSSSNLKLKLHRLGTHFLREREQCRWNLVNQMLSRSDQSITEIAWRAGFSEPSTFYRAFKRWSNGKTPADFRAKYREASCMF